MTQKLLSFLLPFLFFCLTGKAQIFNKPLHTPQESSSPLALDFTVDKGGLLCTTTNDSSYVYASDYYLVRINSNGDTVWTKRNGFDAYGCRAIVRDIAQLPCGDHVVAVAFHSETYLRYLKTGFYRLDSNGNVVHSILHDCFDYWGDVNVTKADHSGYYISYSYDSLSSDGRTSAVSAQRFIEKHDSNNVLVWTKKFVDSFWIVGPNPDDGSFWSSSEGQNYKRLKMYQAFDKSVFYTTRNKLGHLDVDGNTTYETALSALLDSNFQVYTMFGTSDTGVVLSTYSDEPRYTLLKVNSSGIPIHHVEMRDTFDLNEGTELSNGKYLLVAPFVRGFLTYDSSLSRADTIRNSVQRGYWLYETFKPNPYGGAFCAYGFSTSVYVCNFDSLFNSHRDLQLSMSAHCLVPGFTSHLRVGVHNHGNQVIDTTVWIILDSNTSFASSVPVPFALSGDTAFYRIDSLHPDSTDSIIVAVRVDSSIGLGVLLTFHAVSPYPNNLGTHDDSIVYYATTVSSYDPNSKSVNRPFYFTPDKDLTYTINFENTGNYYATNVKVEDALDPNLDPSTLKIISGNPVFPIIEVNGSNAVFNFPGIYLSDSTTDPEACNGQFTYSIKTRTSTYIGDTIRNTAYIYFDYNQPIATNTTLNVISNENSGPHILPNHFSLFPNPSRGPVTINLPSTSSDWQIIISDVTGRLVSSTHFNGNTTTLDLKMSKGIYFVKVKSNSTKETYVAKMVRE